MKKLILIGYWHSWDQMDWPDPAWFVDPTWEPETKNTVITHLERGKSINSYLGMSWCRFRCREYGHSLGSHEQTDGVYCWPTGLAHYLKSHAVRLPEEFVAHVLRQDARSPGLDLPSQGKDKRYSITNEWWRAQQGFVKGESYLSPTPYGVVIAVLPPGRPDDSVLSFLHRYRFVPYWRIKTEEFFAEVQNGAEYTGKENLDHWRFADLEAKANAIGLQLKFIENPY